MSDDYFPFDFGSWKAPKPMICPRHGPQDGGLLVSVTAKRGEAPIVRKCCGLCVIDALDRISALQGDA
jgi:hypothetical protein